MTCGVIAVRLTKGQPARSKAQPLAMLFAIVNTSGVPLAIQASAIPGDAANFPQLLSDHVTADGAVGN